MNQDNTGFKYQLWEKLHIKIIIIPLWEESKVKKGHGEPQKTGWCVMCGNDVLKVPS